MRWNSTWTWDTRSRIDGDESMSSLSALRDGQSRDHGATACYWLLRAPSVHSRYARPHAAAPGKQAKRLADAARPGAELSAPIVPHLRPEKRNAMP